ncbi:class I SAM-dependent methyltransferase [Sulfuriferula thiophila]|uniref:class I SAM-dependent methyltransferase n=1 Tax=Sulfuriferula thiophila TaxID=1781211 RepID=UPI000F6080C6|nr:methyltransferase domain-containing protein [Sulfuriferula thiophila]
MTTRYTSFSDWLASPLGQYLQAREQAYFDQAVADLFGFNALQVGLPYWDMLRNSRIPHRFRVADSGTDDVLAEPTQLPFANQSVDLLVLPHLLEFSSYPHQILREAERVLIAEGSLLISGFNPRSLWGVHRWYKHKGGEYPWRGDFVNLSRLKDWLSLLGCDVVSGRMCCYAPPLANAGMMQYFEFMESAGDRWWGMGGGVYFIHAVKRVHGMRLITPRWQSQAKLARALSPATRSLQNGSKCCDE